MEAIAYKSYATKAFDARSLHKLQYLSKMNNIKRHVTGLLLFVPDSGEFGAFFQYIEGPKLETKLLLSKILQDHRHSDVTMLHHGPITQRRYPNWDMHNLDVSKRPPLLRALGKILDVEATGPEIDFLANPTLAYLDAAHAMSQIEGRFNAS